jgi:choice-of-anchor C domain-containing protein
LRKCTLLLTLLGSALSAQASVIFIDGFNFDQGSVPNSFTTVDSGLIGPWTVGGNGVDRIGGYWQAAEGNGSIDMSALAAGTLTTNLTTVPGENYLLSFYLAGNPDGGDSVKLVNVSVGSLDRTFSFDISGVSKSSMGWVLESASFTAPGSVTSLTFTSLENNAYGPALDGVTVSTATPEPATYIIALLGLAGMGLLRRRRLA